VVKTLESLSHDLGARPQSKHCEDPLHYCIFDITSSNPFRQRIEVSSTIHVNVAIQTEGGRSFLKYILDLHKQISVASVRANRCEVVKVIYIRYNLF